MQFKETTALHRIVNMRCNLRLVAGGTSASKTISILTALIDIAQSSSVEQSGGLPIGVFSETMPHMRGGAMLDFENIMRAQGYWNDELWNKTHSVYTFETGIKMRFLSTDSPSKVHGPRWWIAYLNEANNIPYNVADHIMVRTKWLVYLDWNPSSEFWAYTEIINNPNYIGQYDFITLTYLDNEALDTIVVQRIESHKNNQAWWNVYGLGQLGEIEGRIYTDWKWIDEIPHEARFVKRGLDFGYTNDPTGIIDVYEYNGGFIFDERLYAYGQSNEDIADFVKSLPNANQLIIADSSEPKSIARLQTLGLNVLPAIKGAGSINVGIDFIQSKPISATKRSTNLKKEYERYVWLKDRLTDSFINKAPDIDNHLLDPARYALESYFPRDDDEEPAHTGTVESLFY